MLPKKLGSLAAVWNAYPDELRADIQEHYGIDLDHAAAGAHSASHVAVLCEQLPRRSRTARAMDPDCEWGLRETLLATAVNHMAYWRWGMADRRSRGAPPQLVGPSWVADSNRRTASLPSRVITIDQLMDELGRPRGA